MQTVPHGEDKGGMDEDFKAEVRTKKHLVSTVCNSKRCAKDDTLCKAKARRRLR